MNTILNNTSKNNDNSYVKKVYFETQNIICKSYFNNILNRVETIEEIEQVKNKFNDYKKTIGISSDYNTINDYEKEFEERVKNKIIEIQNKNALMVIKYNKIFYVFSKIKKLFTNSSNEYNK